MYYAVFTDRDRGIYTDNEKYRYLIENNIVFKKCSSLSEAKYYVKYGKSQMINNNSKLNSYLDIVDIVDPFCPEIDNISLDNNELDNNELDNNELDNNKLSDYNHLSKNIVITKNHIKQAIQSSGKWYKEQLSILDINFPPHKNWKKDIIGNTVELDILNEFIHFKSNNTVKLTNIHLTQGRSHNNTYKSKQLELLGLEKPIHKDWKKMVLGKLYNINIIDEFISYNKT